MNKKILIIGDTIIDENIFLKASGLSLETPTIKTDFLDCSFDFGGCANVAKYLKKEVAEVTFVTSMSEYHANVFEERYQKVKLINIPVQKSNIKKRYWVNHGDERYKYLQINDINNENNAQNKVFLIEDIGKHDIVAISDYRCGLIDLSLIDIINKQNVKTFAASQLSSNKPNYNLYKNMDWIVCNKNESEYVDRKAGICITDGSNGCFVNGRHYPGYPTEVFNTMGAGDRFYAAFIATCDGDYANKMAKEFVSKPI